MLLVVCNIEGLAMEFSYPTQRIHKSFMIFMINITSRRPM